MNITNKTFIGIDLENAEEHLLHYICRDICRGDSLNNSLYFHTVKERRSEGRIRTFQYMYGTRFKHIPVKIKKGAGKGNHRLQKVKINSKNLVDNLTWLK